MMSKRILLYTCLPILLLLWQSCGIYSFSGASVPPEVQTVSVLYFKNEASLVNARLSPLLTEKMQNKSVNETRLNLKDRGGDLEFSGAVVNYTVVPVALNSNERASLSRLTIEVRCTYLNRLSQETWTNSFTRYEDFESTLTLREVEDQLIENITKQITDDIFNKALVNW